MNESIHKAHLAMMDGDRDTVLDLIEKEPSTADVIWLRAQCVLDPKLRLTLLERLATVNEPVFSGLAEKIILREQDFSRKLAEIPEYQFWKRPGWREKVSAFRQQKVWLLGLVAVSVISLLLILALVFQPNTSTEPAEETVIAVQPSPRPTPSVTALPSTKRPRISYPAGDFSIVRVENPTMRLVITGNSSDPATPAVPAVGASFLAIQFEFLCRVAICENPPEAQISLKLSDGNIVSNSSAVQPVLAEFPRPIRIAKDQAVSGWLVFEVPNQAVPAALLFPSDQGFEAPPLELLWPR